MLYQSTCVGLGYGLMEGYFQEPLHIAAHQSDKDERTTQTIRHILLAQEY